MDEWNNGEPPAQGWYDCLLNGEDIRLRWWICIMNPRKRHWIDENGAYRELDGEVLWTGKPSASVWG